MIRSSQRGRYHARSPSSAITAGTIVIRTTKASNRTPKASAKPMLLIVGSPPRMKLPNTEPMIRAAAVTTRAPCRKPPITDSVGVSPCMWSSRIRLTRKTS